MAFVVYYDSTGNPLFSCSGTLVSSNVVLTAGHCAVDESTGAPLDPSGYRVVTGAVDWTDTAITQISTVSQTLIDPSFDPTTLDHDAALLVLSAPVDSPSIPLWGSGELFAGTGATIAGWGETYAGDPVWQTVLQSAPTVVQSTDYCAAEAPGGYFYDSSTELCAVDAPSFDTGTCNGDSGGPLLIQDSTGSLIEAGVISVGPADCNTITADYFTAVLSIEPWIASEASAVAPAPPPPPPTTTTPSATTTTAPTTPTLPTMTKADARSYVRQVIAHIFKRRVRHALRISSCGSAATKSHIRCSFSFWSGPNDYWGFVTVYYYAGPNGTTYWASHYSTYWVNDHCYFHTNHRQSCRIHRREGSW